MAFSVFLSFPFYWIILYNIIQYFFTLGKGVYTNQTRQEKFTLLASYMQNI